MRRNYLALWLLLAVAFAAMAAVSVFGPVRIFGFELRDSGLARNLTASRLPSAPMPEHLICDTAACDSVAEPETVPLDTASKVILFFGDSMLDGLYPRLAAYADRNGHELYAVIWYSSTSEVWGTSDRLRNYIASLHPDYIFISLGANELFVKDIEEKRAPYVKKILEDIGDIPYLWIGPPNWKDDTGINRLIESSAAPGCYFRSARMTFERKKDGAHPTEASARAWMDSIARWMPAHSAHPIRLDVPDKSKGRAKRVFVHQPGEK